MHYTQVNAVRVSPKGDATSCLFLEVKPCWQGFNWMVNHVGIPHSVCPLGSEHSSHQSHLLHTV